MPGSLRVPRRPMGGLLLYLREPGIRRPQRFNEWGSPTSRLNDDRVLFAELLHVDQPALFAPLTLVNLLRVG